MTSPTLTFLGAVGTVTGSRFLVEGERGRLLVDAAANACASTEAASIRR